MNLTEICCIVHEITVPSNTSYRESTVIVISKYQVTEQYPNFKSTVILLYLLLKYIEKNYSGFMLSGHLLSALKG